MDREAKAKLLVLGPRPVHIGGVETVTSAILDSKAFDSFELRYFDTTKGRPKHTQSKFDLMNSIWGLIFAGRMFKWMVTFRPKIVYMPLVGRWAPFLRDTLLATIGRLFGAKVVGHIHGGSLVNLLHTRGPIRYFVKLCIGRFSALLPLGTPILQELQDFGYKGYMHVVPSTLEKPFLQRALDFQRTHSGQTIKALFVGHVGDNKGVPELLHAMVATNREGLPITLRVVGPDEHTGDLERMKKLSSQLHMDSIVTFTGAQRGDDLHREFETADVLTLPSHKEMLPVVILEAGAYGLCVITTPVGAIPDLIHDDNNGMLVEPGNVNSIVDALRKVLDPNLRARLGNQLRQDVQRYDPERVTHEIASVLNKIASS